MSRFKKSWQGKILVRMRERGRERESYKINGILVFRWKISNIIRFFLLNEFLKQKYPDNERSWRKLCNSSNFEQNLLLFTRRTSEFCLKTRRFCSIFSHANNLPRFILLLLLVRFFERRYEGISTRVECANWLPCSASNILCEHVTTNVLNT